MSFIAAAVIGGTALVGGYLSSKGAKDAANIQANAANQASANSMDQFNTINQQNQPWIQQGTTAINQLGTLTAPGSAMQTPFTAADLTSNLAPNYKFQLDQGLGATKNAANLQSGLVGGNAIKAANDYAQNFAGNAYQNAFNNFNASNTNIFNRLSAIAGLGQTSSANNATAGIASVGAANNYLTGGAAAQAAGQVGSANAISGGLSGVSGMYGLNNLTSGKLFGGGGASGTGGGGSAPIAGFGGMSSAGYTLPE